MARMKTFLLYLILFIAFFICITLLSNWGMKTLINEFSNIKISTESPIIAVDKCETGKYSGNINGTVRNNTGKHIEKAYLKITGYDNDGRLIGTQYEELKYFNVNEILKFDTTFNFEDLEEIELSVIYDENEVAQVSEQNNDWGLGNVITEGNLGIALPVVAGMLLFVIF